MKKSYEEFINSDFYPIPTSILTLHYRQMCYNFYMLDITDYNTYSEMLPTDFYDYAEEDVCSNFKEKEV